MAEPQHEIRFDPKGNALGSYDLRVTARVDPAWLSDHGYDPEEDRLYGWCTVYLAARPKADKVDGVVLDAIARGEVSFRCRRVELDEHGFRKVDHRTIPRAIVQQVTNAQFSNRFDADVLAHFFAGTPADKCARLFRQNRTRNPRGRYMGFRMRRDHSMAEAGSMRLWYSHTGVLYSYDMPLGMWLPTAGGRLFLVNGDGAPTNTTGRHQRWMREYLEDLGQGGKLVVTALRPHAIVPYSVLRSAGVDFDELQILDASPAKVVLREETCRRKDCDEEGEHTHTVEDHFLGETLFRNHLGQYFLSGLDRNDSPSKRSFYLCQVPGSPETIERAIEALRPDGVPADTPRQGEWFFVPEPGYRPAKDEKTLRATGVPIVDERADRQLRAMQKYTTHDDKLTYGVPGREGRHVASTLVVDGAVYARGVVRDREHSPLHLGKTFHRVVKNRAVEGWRYDAQRMRARVD